VLYYIFALYHIEIKLTHQISEEKLTDIWYHFIVSVFITVCWNKERSESCYHRVVGARKRVLWKFCFAALCSKVCYTTNSTHKIAKWSFGCRLTFALQLEENRALHQDLAGIQSDCKRQKVTTSFCNAAHREIRAVGWQMCTRIAAASLKTLKSKNTYVCISLVICKQFKDVVGLPTRPGCGTTSPMMVRCDFYFFKSRTWVQCQVFSSPVPHPYDRPSHFHLNPFRCSRLQQ